MENLNLPEITPNIEDEEDLVNGLARIIYTTNMPHWRPAGSTWKDASEADREWTLAQARTILAYLEGICPAS